MFRRASAIVLALAASALAAQPPPKDPPRAARAPSEIKLSRGPIKITAERAELEQRETALYRGNVRMVSAELELTGDRLELRQPVKGQFEAHLTGRPARLKHKGQGDLPPVAASASEIRYDTRSAIVDLKGGANLERGTDSLSSDSISYNLVARRISASGEGEGQVQIIIQPPENGSSPPAREKGAGKPQNTPPDTKGGTRD